MRTIIDLPEKQVAALDRLSRSRRLSRAELIRRAVGRFIDDQTPDRGSAFGLWTRGGRPVDGLALQRRLRREWDR